MVDGRGLEGKKLQLIAAEEFIGQRNILPCLPTIENWSDSPEQRYAAGELRKLLARALLNLSNKKTAAMLGLSVGTVKMRVLRCSSFPHKTAIGDDPK